MFRSNLRKKAGQKCHTPVRVAKFMEQDRLKFVMNVFILSQFNNSPIIWIVHDRRMNCNIKKIYERALRISFRDTSSNSDKLLTNKDSVIVHQRDLQLLKADRYKNRIDLNPVFKHEAHI